MNYNEIRKNTKNITVGKIGIGGDNPLWIQSMLNTKSEDFESCKKQTQDLFNAGCRIVRLAVNTKESLDTVYKLKESFPDISFVSDIQFDYKMALGSVDAGIDKVRINPGNIGDEAKVKEVVNKCNSKNIPIRIGINSGSLEKEVLEKYGRPTAEALVESAVNNIKLLEKYDFNNIIVSIKSTSVMNTIKANKLFSQQYNYPIHIGVTESGSGEEAMVKSTAAVSSLLSQGIGDTIRISLTDSPVKEIYAAEKILKSLELYEKPYINIISCPTCGRTQINLIEIVEKVKSQLKDYSDIKKSVTIAIMGCVVNGPGEAAEADIGIAGGKDCAVLFSHGKILRKIDECDIVNCILTELNNYR